MKILSFIYFLLLKLRYKIKIEWFEKIDKNKKYLVFPNHEALVDPQIVFSLVGQKISLSPVISETYYNLPVLKYFFKIIWAVPIWDIQRWTWNKENIEKSFQSILEWIKNWKNILVYPAGQLYNQWYEVIRGKKIAFNLVQGLPNNVEIIVIKTTWLRWSIWSKAYVGKSPNFLKTFLKSIFIILVNLIFFVPKREVKIEIQNLTKELKNIKDLNDFNKYLEDFYNKDWVEEVRYLKHFFYFDDVKWKKIPQISWSVENVSEINQKDIPFEIFEKIRKKASEIKELSKEKIFINSNIVTDLYFDSLDASELKSFVQLNFKNSSNPPITDLKTIWNFCMMALWVWNKDEELKACNWQEVDKKDKKIYEIINENQKKLWDKSNILSIFKETFKNSKNEDFVYDSIFWLQTKKDFLIKAYLISSYIKKIEGKYIWIMLPSVSSASIIVISVYLAWKIPVMLNWTVWEKSLEHCIKFANIDNILTSKNFYSKIENEVTKKFDEKYLFLEEMLKDISLFSKIKALINSKIFSIPNKKYDDEAVILFTSWSESLPKAVSLTHKNIISDILWSLYHFPLQKSDILMWFLPPFHSFWFSINTIMPLIWWLRVVYTPDPNDSKTISNLINFTKTTALTSTPTFLKMILNSLDNKKLESIKYSVVWAEKCPDSLFEKFSNFCPNWEILEWYWITECSPVISLNPPWKSKKWSVWVSIFHSDIKIVSLETKEFLEANTEGMIYFSWENVFTWYLDENIESPFEKIWTDTFSDDWIKVWHKLSRYYKTWDLWYLDEEWYLFITWRLKRFVKIAWEMISLPFIENIINKKYWSDTENKIAIEYKEENSLVKIVLFTIDNLNLDEIQSYLRENWISNLVKISEIIKIENIPVLGTWKIDYKILKDMIRFEKKNYNFKDLKWTIIKKISELSKIDISKINENSLFWKDIFLDSIDVWELKIFIKANYKIEENIEIKNVKIVWDLIDLVKNYEKN
jgi:acyl-CoA synthetase (AMP-forming)/AMP-acid ligase II/acyl carrier protein